MKKNILPLICLLFLASQTTVFAQCGDANQTTFITSQAQVDALADCEAFTGDLSITGDVISSLQAMSSLLMVAGNLNIYDTSIESLAGLENILGAGEINIYNNANLNSCCQALE